VLLNNYCDFDKALRKRLQAALSPHFNITELHYGHYTGNSWAYLNFLHVGRHIFVPMIDDKLGETAFKQIAAAYPNCQCHPIANCQSIVNEGGALNCSTWNTLMN
jgi:agmatine/peptidylarginine deiminase